MATFKNSTFGVLRKSIGDDVAYRMGGQNIVRKKPAYTRDAQSAEQLKRRSALTTAVNVFRVNANVLRNTFPERDIKHSAYNTFASLFLKNAVEFINSNLSVNWKEVQISKGNLPTPVATDFQDMKDGEVALNFINQKDDVQLFGSDVLNIVGIDTAIKKSAILYASSLDQSMPEGADISIFPSGSTIAVYAYHATFNSNKVSDSVFLGFAKF